jgi:hypothetical protein
MSDSMDLILSVLTFLPMAFAFFLEVEHPPLGRDYLLLTTYY